MSAILREFFHNNRRQCPCSDGADRTLFATMKQAKDTSGRLPLSLANENW